MRIIFLLQTITCCCWYVYNNISVESWFDTYYIPSKQELSTLQYELQKLLASSFSQSTAQRATMTAGEMASNLVTPVSLQAAITIIAMVPILCVYPLLQRYFIAGLNVGGVKE